MIANYVLEVEARDNGVPSLASNVLVTIEISDANDNPPVFSQANYTAIAQEDKPLGFTILKLQVIDKARTCLHVTIYRITEFPRILIVQK